MGLKLMAGRLASDLFKSAELEFLHRSPWGCVFMPPRRSEPKLFPKNSLQALRIVTGNGQAAAFLWPIHCEGADHGFATDFESPCQHANIGLLIGGCCQEMEGGSVMPEIILAVRRPYGHIRYNPLHMSRVCQSGLGCPEGRARKIKNANVGLTGVYQRIYQPRHTTTNVDY